MNDISLLSRLSFFKIDKFVYNERTVCDFNDCPRPHYCLGYILEGSAVFSFDGKQVAVGAGDMIFVPVTSRYTSVWTPSPTASYISFHFSFDVPSLFKRERNYEIQAVRNKNLRESFISALKLSQEGTASQLGALSCFFEVMNIIYPILQYSQSVRLDPRIKQAADYIERHCDLQLTVPAIARLVHMSESHFYSCFKTEFGTSPIGYKHRCAVNRAMLMLIQDETTPIETISEQLGFGSAMHFRRVFKKLVGISPTEYRKNGKKQQ